MSANHSHFAKRMVIAIALVAGALLIWQLRDVMMLLFAAINAHALNEGTKM